MKLKLTINENIIIKILLLLLILCVLIPSLYISIYNTPGASDDVFHGFFQLEKSYFSGIYYWYKDGYNGRFSNSFFMQLPGRPFMNLGFAKVFPIVSFILLFVAIFYWIKGFSKELSFQKLALFSGMLLVYFISYTPNIQQFYWYSGYTVYVLPGIFYFFMLGFLLRFFNQSQSILKIIILSILLFFLVGSHENWMILTGMTVYFFVFNTIINQEKIHKTTIYLLVITTVLCGLMLFAPGTSNRIVNEGNGTNNRDLLASFSFAIFHSGEFILLWFFKSGLFIAGIAIMLMKKTNEEKSKFYFSNKITINMVVFLLVVYSGLFVLIYSLGLYYPLRTRGIVPNFFVSSLIFLAMFLNLSQTKLIESIKNNINDTVIYVLFFVSTFVCVFNSENVKNIYNDFISGDAKIQAEQSQWLLKYISESKEENLEIPQLDRKSKTLYSIEIPKQNEGWFFWATRTFYKKTSIVENKNISLKGFIENYERIKNTSITSIEGIKNSSPYSNTKIYDIEEIKGKTIKVNVIVEGQNINELSALVFESYPYRFSLKLISLIKEGGILDYNYEVPSELNSNENKKLKVYIHNPTDDIIYLKNLTIELE